MKKIKLLILVSLLYPIQLWAADFNVNGIYYNITGENTVEVTNNAPEMGVYSGNVEIPESVVYEEITYSVTGIGQNAFMLCNFLTSIIIPGSVENIESNAFFLCGTLSSVVIPEGVKNIKDGAFSRCNTLISVSIPNTVKNIGNSVFANCTNLNEITVAIENPSIVNYGANIFDAVNTENCILKVPDGTLSAYNTYPWFDFDNIETQDKAPTDISQVNFNTKIYAQNNTIIVENTTVPICIYDLLGNFIVKGENGQFKMPQSGVYIVKTGKSAQKIIVR